MVKRLIEDQEWEVRFFLVPQQLQHALFDKWFKSSPFHGEVAGSNPAQSTTNTKRNILSISICNSACREKLVTPAQSTIYNAEWSNG